MFKNKIVIIAIAILSLFSVGCKDNQQDIKVLEEKIQTLEQTINDYEKEKNEDKEIEGREVEDNIYCNECKGIMNQVNSDDHIHNDIYECQSETCHPYGGTMFCIRHQEYYYNKVYCTGCNADLEKESKENEEQFTCQVCGRTGTCTETDCYHSTDICVYCGKEGINNDTAYYWEDKHGELQFTHYGQCTDIFKPALLKAQTPDENGDESDLGIIIPAQNICPDCDSQLDENGVCGFCSIPDICPYCGGYTNDWGWCLKDCQGTNKYE